MRFTAARLVLSSVLFLSVSSSASAVTLPLCTAGSGLACVASGNDPVAAVEAAIFSATGLIVDLTLYGKSDDNPALFTFSNFDQGTDLDDSKSGAWSILDGTLVAFITVKAANSFIVFAVNPAASSGTYSTMGILTGGGQQPEVSHISFWTSQADVAVPEPASLLLLASGMGCALVRRRRKA